MENTSFRLRDNIDYNQVNFTDNKVGADAITDEMILDFLRANPNRISLFSTYPANWKELLQGTEPEAAVDEILTLEEPTSKNNKSKRTSK